MTRTRRHVLMFMPRFHQLVERGVKCQTIRHERSRKIAPGDTLSLRAWTGRPRGSSHRILRTATCLRVEPITIRSVDDGCSLSIALSGACLDLAASQKFAPADGFESLAEMAEFWRKMHKFPFEGIVISWKPLP